jgi:type IV pilus assembly protein PilA
MKSTIQKVQQGFTLIELMIVVAIIGILASIAIPSYQGYIKKAKFTEVIMATTAVKSAVELCAQSTNALTACGGGQNGVPANTTMVVTAANGTITATGGATVDNMTYILTPTLAANGAVGWSYSGTCKGVGATAAVINPVTGLESAPATLGTGGIC